MTFLTYRLSDLKTRTEEVFKAAEQGSVRLVDDDDVEVFTLTVFLGIDPDEDQGRTISITTHAADTDTSYHYKETNMSKDIMDNIDNWFTYHPPKGDQQERYVKIREAAKHLATTIVECTPPSADQSAAIRKVREAVMTANASIACGE